MRIELQYIGTRLAKSNYLLPEAFMGKKVTSGVFNRMEFRNSCPEYVYLLQQLSQKVNVTKAPTSISAKDGKITAYGGYSIDVDGEFARFGRNHDPKHIYTHSVSHYDSGKELLKVYDKRVHLHNLPELPERAQKRFGIATTYNCEGKKVGRCEVFFSASMPAMTAWVKKYALGSFMPDMSYYGVSFDNGRPVGPIKGCLRPMETAHTENCWVAGENIRAGTLPTSKEGQRLLAQVPPLWLYDKAYITNVGSNFYDLNLDEPVEIISVYYNMVQPSQGLLKKFRVPTDDHPKWFGIKHAPKYGWTWLKVASMNYDAFDFPELPVGAEKTFGVASVYPLTDDQPEHHSSTGGTWVDISFSTKDHAAVRAYCSRFGIADPAPHLPDTLGLWGVYSLTYNAETKTARRMKFYDYEGTQKYMMEMYVSSVLNGGRPMPEVIGDACKTVMDFNFRKGLW